MVIWGVLWGDVQMEREGKEECRREKKTIRRELVEGVE
jgi:hypothetical protein